MFLCALLLTSVSAVAEDWPLKIMGVQVTSDNASSIYKIGDETVFRAEKKGDGSYWLYIRQPEGVDEIVCGEDYNIIDKTKTCELHIVVENDVVMRSTSSKDCISTYSGKLYFSSISGWNSLTITCARGFWLNDDEIHISDVHLIAPEASFISHNEASLFVEDYGFLSAFCIWGFKSITTQPGAITNAASFSDTGDGHGVAARDANGEEKRPVYVGIRKFPVTIAGIELTDLNAGSITGEGISALDADKTSKLSFDTDKNTLVMDNVKVEPADMLTSGIRYINDKGTLNVSVSNNSSIVSMYFGIESRGGVNIIGSKKLYVEGGYGIVADGDVAIKGVCHVKGSSSAIWGNVSGTLDLSGLKALKAEGGYVVIGGFGYYVGPKDPDDYVSNASFFDAEDGYSVAARDEEESAIMGSTVLMAKKMGKIAAQEVTAADEYFSDGTITGEGISGKVTLKDDAIWLEDATIEALTDAAPIGISNATTIYLVGKNTIKAKNTGILLGKTDDEGYTYLLDGNPEGDENPQLTIESGQDGISATVKNSTFRMVGVTLEIDAEEIGFNGYEASGKVTVSFMSNSRALLRGKGLGTVMYVANLSFGGTIDIVTPDVTLEKYITGSCLMKDGKLTTDWVEIRPVFKYILVGDLEVTEFNIDAQPFSHPSITGSVTYDKETGVLTLEDATLTTTNPMAIAGAVSQIVLKGNNTINCMDPDDKYVIYCEDDLSITGNGTLTAEDACICLDEKGAKLEIQDVSINGVFLEACEEGTMELSNCTFDGVGIQCYPTAELNINNCNFNGALKGASLMNDGTIEFNNCTLTDGGLLSNSDTGTLSINNSTFELKNISAFNFGVAFMNIGSVTIGANSSVSAHGLYFGYWSDEGSSTLTIDNSTLRLKADNNYIVDGMDKIPSGAALGYNLTLVSDLELDQTDGASLYEGEGGYFEIQRGGERATDWVEIHPTKYFKIGDLEVTAQNMGEQPFSDPSIDGSVTFDKEMGVITLENTTVTPTGDDKCGIDVGSPRYKNKVSQIVLTGSNTFNVEDGDNCIYSSSYLLINGGGSLTADGARISNADAAYMQMENVSVNGVFLSNDDGCSMDLNNWTLTNGKGIENLGTMNFNNSLLEIEGADKDAAIQNQGSVSIYSNSHITAHGNYFGYYDNGVATSSLTIDNSTLRLKADNITKGDDPTGAAIGHNLNIWGDMELEATNGESLYSGVDEYFEVRRNDERAADWVTFTVPADKKKYDIYVGGTQVTGLNLEGVTGENIEGTVTYDPMARRLTLTNATIGDGGVSIGYGMGGQELMLCGNNAITGEDPMGSSLTVNEGLTITSPDGTGKLTIDNKMFGAFTGGTWTVVRNCELDFKSEGTGMTGMGTLTIEGSKVRVQGATGSLVAFSSVTLGEDMFYEKPDGCVYNTETSQLEVGGELYTGEVVFRYVKNYGIQIGDFAVNSDNYDAIKPAVLKDGTITFDPKTSHLTLSGVRLENGGITANSSIEELTIVVDGECSITEAEEPLKLLCPAFIVSKNSVEEGKPGQGILNDKLSIATDQTGVYFDGMLYVNDVAVTVTAGKKALAGSGPGSLMYVNTSNIEATGTSDGAITSIGTLDLYERMRFVNPDQSFDEETGCVAEGGSAAKTVTIKWYMPGDANDDYQVDVSDVKDIADNIWEVENPGFVAYNADLNADDVINVTDIVGVVDIILESSATARAKSGRTLARGESRETTDRLSLTWRSGLLAAALTNAENYYGLQMELRLSPGQTLNAIALSGSCANSHQVAWRQTGEDTYRVVIYALSPSALIGGNRQMLTLDISGEGTVEASDILAVATDGTRYLLTSATSDMATGIEEMPSAGHEATGIYDLNGRKVSGDGTLRKGIYIREGKKVIVK